MNEFNDMKNLIESRISKRIIQEETKVRNIMQSPYKCNGMNNINAMLLILFIKHSHTIFLTIFKCRTYLEATRHLFEYTYIVNEKKSCKLLCWQERRTDLILLERVENTSIPKKEFVFEILPFFVMLFEKPTSERSGCLLGVYALTSCDVLLKRKWVCIASLARPLSKRKTVRKLESLR